MWVGGRRRADGDHDRHRYPHHDDGSVAAVTSAAPVRRPFAAGDLLRLLLGIAVVLGGIVIAEVGQGTVTGFERDLLRAVARLPDRLERGVLVVVQVATSLVPLAALTVLLVRRRWRVALVLLVAGMLASVAMAFADALVLDHDLGAFVARLTAVEDHVLTAAYPSAREIAATTAVVTVAVPWLPVAWKRALWGGVAALVLLRLIALHPVLDLVLALGVGTVVGSAVLLVFGSPSRAPSAAELDRALRVCGFVPDGLRQVEAAEGGALGYAFHNGAVAHAVVLRTPDQRDAELVQRLYRAVRFRASEVRRPYATLKRRIEHEVLALVLAGRAGARVPAPVRIGTTDSGSAFAVLDRPDLVAATGEDLRRPELLDDLWRQVGALHDAGLAHRAITWDAVAVDAEGRPWLTGFDRAETAPEARERARDVAELLTATGLVVGVDDAVDAALRGLGAERVVGALRMLQPLALPPATRRRARTAGDLLARLRAAITAATGAPDLELEPLERVRPRTALIVGVSALAFYALLPQLANVGETVAAFGDARPSWLLATLVASAGTYVFAAVSFQGSVAVPLPLVPNLRAQVAASFAGLVGPAGAGGFALTDRFLQRVGVGAAEAGASVAVNATAGLVVHVVLLVGFVLWAGAGGLDGFSLPDAHTVLLALAVLLALLGALALVAPVRRRVVDPAVRAMRTGAGQIAEVFRSPVRVAALFGGSAAISLTYIVAAWAAVEAFGGGLTVAQVGAAYLGAMALATLAPTPGGLGAVESALIASFTGFGLADGLAVSATLTFRLATFWLPLLPGWVALGVMQRRDEV